MLTHSAIKTKDGNIYIGLRHHNILNNNCGVDFKNGIQGFVDHQHNFYNREEALKVAIEFNQLKNNKTISNILTSEDLW
jgi:hypothetical protein